MSSKHAVKGGTERLPGAQPVRYPAPTMDRLMGAALVLHNGLIQCVIPFDGPVDEGRMARAVQLLLEAMPILDCTFVHRFWRAFWERPTVPSDPFSFVPTSDPAQAVRGFLEAPMATGPAPQIAVRLVRPQEPARPCGPLRGAVPEPVAGQDLLCLRVHHLVVDGRGFLECVELLCHIYRQLRADPAWRPSPQPMGRRSLGQVLRGAGFGRALRACFHSRYPHSDWGLAADSRDLSGRAFRYRRAPGERLARVRQYARERGVPFTDVIAAAYYRALVALLSPPPGARLPMEMTIDLRRHLPEGRAVALCNVAGGFYPILRHDPDASFEEVLAAVSRENALARQRETWLGGALLLEATRLLPPGLQMGVARWAIDRELASGKAHPFYANLGIVDPGRFDLGDARAVDLVLHGPVTFPPNVLLVAYTFGDTLWLTTAFPDTAVDPARIEGLLDRVLAELPGQK